MTESSPLGNISTYTYRDSQGTASEVLLLPLSRERIGTENTFPPPTLTENNLANWMRSGYFFMDSDVLVQLPRNADDLPLDQNASQATDVFHRDGYVDIYYPVNRDKAVCITWEYGIDDWQAEYVECQLLDGGVNPEEVSGTIVWSISPEKVEKYTD